MEQGEIRRGRGKREEGERGKDKTHHITNPCVAVRGHLNHEVAPEPLVARDRVRLLLGCIACTLTTHLLKGGWDGGLFVEVSVFSFCKILNIDTVACTNLGYVPPQTRGVPQIGFIMPPWTLSK